MSGLTDNKLSNALDALRLIQEGAGRTVELPTLGTITQDAAWCAGVAMSALASMEELDALGECYWHPGEPFTMAARLCDDGVVGDLDAGGYLCTGGAHRFGEHIKCTSPSHTAVSLAAAGGAEAERQ